ncbi:hypothetical protein L484_008441 [Morus notabilis]|uniref:Uncharacterized protein n=1 Tax=Morus notabilis TaxID=981085 RepID=W9SDU2_9ROSA|nr:hypothetical protein L484_008441 [Morus notabilis]
MAVQLQLPVLRVLNPRLKLNSRTPTSFNLNNPALTFSPSFSSTLGLRFSSRRCRFVPGCGGAGRESLVDDRRSLGEENIDTNYPPSTAFDERSEEEEGIVEVKREELVSQGMWSQMKEIAMFTGPLTGLWICGPLMSLIDTAVIGQGSSLELAALGPGTVLCDNLSYVFMFLSIATSNMVATALAKRDKKEVQHHISVLLFVGLACGSLMLLFTRFFGPWALTAFSGAKNSHVVPAANTYAQKFEKTFLLRSRVMDRVTGRFTGKSTAVDGALPLLRFLRQEEPMVNNIWNSSKGAPNLRLVGKRES